MNTENQPEQHIHELELDNGFRCKCGWTPSVGARDSSDAAGASNREADSNRLDWLIKQCGHIHFETKRKMIEFIYDTEGFNIRTRQAIDKAMTISSDAAGVQPLGEKEAMFESVNSTTQNTVGSRYVVGFMFSPSFEQVVLIRKNKPAWQAGLLNGVGGKIESGESAYDAMRREFSEEAGLDRHWFHFASLGGTNNDGGSFELECFWSREHITSVQCQEVEQLEITDVASIAGRTDAIGNLAWLITLARDFGKGVFPPRIVKAEYGPSVVLPNVASALPVSENSSSAPPASVAPQEEWTTAYVKCFFHLFDENGELLSNDFHDPTSANRVRDAHNSRLREDKKEIERLRRRLEDREKAWRQFELERSELDVWKSHVRGSNEKASSLSAQLTVAREALEKIATQPLHDFEMEEIAASALSSLDKRAVNADHPSPTEPPSIPAHGDIIP